MGSQTVLFVQNSPSLAGSQKSLLRLMNALLDSWMPVLICGSEGWLTEEAREALIPVVVHPFPSSRSLEGRLGGNWLFGRKIARLCASAGFQPALIQANDHIQSLSALSIARALCCPSILTVRSGGMSRRDFEKYGGRHHHRVIAVGRNLYQKIQVWSPALSVSLIENGVEEEEVRAPRAIPSAFPRKVLVPGNAAEGKGWRDLADALTLLEERGRGQHIEFVLLGNDYGQNVADVVGTSRLKQFRIRHMPLTPDFKAAVGQYQFAVNSSRFESFGMALLEVLAAGIPVLSSRTGVADQVIADERFLFEPRNTKELAKKLAVLFDDFSGAEPMIRHAQQVIQSQYCVSRTAAQYMEIYRDVMNS